MTHNQNTNEDELYQLRHSTSHLLAWAMKEYFAKEGNVLFGIGPVIEDGFYYDFILPRPLSEDELSHIESKMRDLLTKESLFQLNHIAAKDALDYFSNQPYKLEIIQDILSEDSETPITTYSVGSFTDLCRGPHVTSTAKINPDGFKLLSLSSAYWKGDSSKAVFTRVYGTAWQNKNELTEYLQLRAEAEKRDHRKIGKQLGLFHFDETAPGSPYWLADGLIIYHELLQFCRTVNKKNHYHEVSTPLINKKSLWLTSGHWEFYRDDMYLVTTEKDCAANHPIELALKPMNCPNAMILFNLKRYSYRDLPLRFSDCDTLHRNEASGALHGLLRVRQFHQDDAHIFLREDQIAAECDALLKMCHDFYSIFNMSITFRLGTRPDAFIGDIQKWEKAEEILLRILNQHVGENNYLVAEGDGAFYGPKIDILMQDSLKRVWQMGTIQLDFQLPERFDCKYVAEDGEFYTPVVIHRAIYGSLERFIGVLIEHTSGNFPAWISPKQIIFIPIADRHIEYCQTKATALNNLGFRVSVDERSERMNAKIRDAEENKIPYILVVGDKEITTDSVSCRNRFTKQSQSLSFSDCVTHIQNNINNKLGNP